MKELSLDNWSPCLDLNTSPTEYMSEILQEKIALY
jgi:hypothetical protein